MSVSDGDAKTQQADGSEGMSKACERDLLYEDLVRRHIDMAFHVARSWCGEDSVAEDLCQIAFIKAYKAFDRFKPGTNFKAWLLKILRNCFIDWTRKQKRQLASVSLDQIQAGQEPEHSTAAPQAIDLDSKEVFYDLFGDEMARMLKDLPQDYQIAVLLCDVEGLSYKEIAEVLDCPVGTVRSRIHRGRHMLQEKLRSYAEKIGYLRKAAS